SSKIKSDFTHPHLVIEDHPFTVVVCALTSNLKRAKAPGNVLLEKGEANLPKQSVVEVGKVTIVDKASLGKFVGTLTEQRIHQVRTGIRYLQHLTQHHG